MDKDLQERLAAKRAARREATPAFGPEEVIKAGDIKAGDFVVRTHSFKWMKGFRGRTVYTAPGCRFDALVEATPSKGWSSIDTGVPCIVLRTRDLHSLTVPATCDVTVRRPAR